MDQVLAQPPTGASQATASPGSTLVPDPEEDWEDGPTQIAFARETPDLAAVLNGLDAPLDTEEAVRRTARGAAARDLPPDPADPFSVLTEVSAHSAKPAEIGGVRDRPVPLPAAPTPSPRGRMPAAAALDTMPDLDLDAPLELAVATGPAVAPRSGPRDPSEDATEVLAFAGPAPVTATRIGDRGAAAGASALRQTDGSSEDALSEATEVEGPDVVAQSSVTQAAPESTLTSPVAVSAVVETEATGSGPLEETAADPAPVRWPRAWVWGLAAAAGGLVLLGGAWLVSGLRGPSSEVPASVASASQASASSAEQERAAPAAAQGASTERSPGEPALVFRSSLEDLRKLTVQCDIGSAKGTTEAVVPGTAASRCTVTAILTDRSRRTAVVKEPAAGVYQCFANDSGCVVL